jgi:predicted MFS family arabinose efflux permease
MLTIQWRWAFLLQVPLCLIAFLAVQQLLNLPKHDRGLWTSKLKRIDLLGAILLLIAVSNALVGLDRGSNVSWANTVTIACGASALPLFAVFIVVEVYVATEPFAPGHIILEKRLIAAYMCNLFAFGGQMGMLFYFPLHLQAVYSMTGTEASLRLIPAIVCGVLGSLFGGFYMQRTGRYYWLTVSCYSTLVLGSVVIVMFSGVLVSSITGMGFGLMICSFSNGLGVTSSLIAIMANTTQSDQAIAIACSYLFRSMGSVFGVSLSATVVNNILRSTLARELKDGKDADKIADMVRKSLDSIRTLDPAVRITVRNCYDISTRFGFGASTALVSGAMMSAWFIKEARLNR